MNEERIKQYADLKTVLVLLKSNLQTIKHLERYFKFKKLKKYSTVVLLYRSKEIL